MFFKALLSVFIFAALTLPGLAATGGQDRLDRQAIRSSLAATKLLNGVAVAGGRLLCVGQRGHVLYSDDQGKTWIQASVPVRSDLLAVHFPTPAKGWAVGHDGVVLHSSDGGITWVKQFDGLAAARTMAGYYREHARKNGSDGGSQHVAAEMDSYLKQGADKPFLDVWFENETSGYIVGAYNLIFRTSDGGKSWVPLFDRIENPKRLHLYAIRPVGQDLFIAGEQGSVFKLDRQTGSFRTLKTPYRGTFFGVTGKPGAVVVFGIRGNVFLSRDAGANWQKVETGVLAGLTGGTVTSDGRIALVSQAGHVLVSSDDGRSFQQVKAERPLPATAVVALGNNTLVIAGLAGTKLQSLK